MHTVNLSDVSAADRELAQTIAQRADVNLRDCYQCGKCAAGCPMADDMDLSPQQVMRALQMGLTEKALSATSPWLCAQCMVCSTRCPQNIDITKIMREVRRESHARGHRCIPESNAFETQFLKGVKADGRNNEQYLAAFFNLKSGHLAQDMLNAPKMLAKGMVGIGKHSVKDRDAVRRIYEKCLEKDGEQK